MRQFNFTIIKLTLFLVLGIVIGYFYPIPFISALIITFSLFFLITTILILTKTNFKKSIWFGLFTFLLFISIGILTICTHNQKTFKNHYSNFIHHSNNSYYSVTFRIHEVLKPGNYHDKYVIDILKINNKSVNGRSLLNIEKDSSKTAIQVDDVFKHHALFKELIHPLNPHQFDYKNYLEKRYIYHQLFSNRNALFKLNSKSNTIYGIANTIRNYINQKLNTYNFSQDELAIINALILGQRQDITKEVFSSYTNAGAIHILAVSGLHIGIILLILSFLFKPLEQFKHGKLIKTILLVFLLWTFALIAGLSASVTRAVTMFSIVAIAMNLKRPTNIYNTLAISIFVILLFKPLFIFDVGFQLSYLAVFAIVVIDPLLYNLWKTKYWIFDKLWHTFTITISAQFGIIPISLYYFHQFPGLFFISNLVIVPFLSFILGLGLFVILLASLNILPELLAVLFGGIINLMNLFVAWVSEQELFLIKDISFNLLYVITSYILIIAIVNLYINRSYKSLILFLFSIVIFQSAMFYTKYNKTSHELVIFHKSRHSLLGQLTHDNLLVSHNSDSLSPSANKIIKNYTIGNHISYINEDTLKPVYTLKNESLLVIDSLGIYNIKTFSPDYVLLIQSPKINLNRLIDSLKPKQLIADGSNYKSYIERWKHICDKRKIPFHNTNEKGAFTINF